MGSAKKKPTYILTAKTAAGKDKLSYHNEKWELTATEIPKYTRSLGLCHFFRSSDGKKILTVQVSDDPDIAFRLI